MEDDILRAWFKEDRWPAILEKDQVCSSGCTYADKQLQLDINSGKSFAGFQEGSIGFPP